MNVNLLIDSIVRQTTVLIAQLATARHVRAPLAHVANQVFLDLAEELSRQGVSRKVSADMFGLALRTYLRKIQRLGEGSTEQGRSIWQAVLEKLQDGGVMTRGEICAHFRHDDSEVVASVLHDLTEGGLVFRAGADNRVERVNVETGLHHEGMVVVTSGLAAGELVVTRGQAGLADGLLVSPRNPDGTMIRTDISAAGEAGKAVP